MSSCDCRACCVPISHKLQFVTSDVIGTKSILCSGHERGPNLRKTEVAVWRLATVSTPNKFVFVLTCWHLRRWNASALSAESTSAAPTSATTNGERVKDFPAVVTACRAISANNVGENSTTPTSLTCTCRCTVRAALRVPSVEKFALRLVPMRLNMSRVDIAGAAPVVTTPDNKSTTIRGIIASCNPTLFPV